MLFILIWLKLVFYWGFDKKKSYFILFHILHFRKRSRRCGPPTFLLKNLASPWISICRRPSSHPLFNHEKTIILKLYHLNIYPKVKRKSNIYLVDYNHLVAQPFDTLTIVCIPSKRFKCKKIIIIFLNFSFPENACASHTRRKWELWSDLWNLRLLNFKGKGPSIFGK